MLEHDLLDRLRIDVVPAADHQILGAPGDPEPAVLVEAAEIAGVHPDVLDERYLVVDVVEIAAEHTGAGHGYEADLVGRAVPLIFALGIQLDDAHAAVGHGQSG